MPHSYRRSVARIWSPGSRFLLPVSPGHPPLRRPGIAKGFFWISYSQIWVCFFDQWCTSLADLGKNMDSVFFFEKILHLHFDEVTPRGLCLYLYGELRHFFYGKQLAVEASKKPSETLCSRLLERSGKKINERGDFDGSKNYTIHMNLGNLARLWQGRCLHLGNPKISCCPKSRMKTDPKHDDWHFGILTCLIWAQELCWDPVSSKEGHHNLQSKLKCTIQIHSSCTLLTYACR